MRKFRLLALCPLLWVLTACGGSGGGASMSAAPQVSAVKVSCTPTMIGPGGTSQCSATVSGTGSYSSGVTWSASGGTISSGGVLTAPKAAGDITVKATSTQDSSMSGTATVTVQQSAPNPSINSVTVSCSPTTIAPGGTSQCAATVSRTGSYSSAVTWSASGGTITAAGILTAPATTGTITVTATSTADTSKSGTATVSVQNSAPVPTITSVSVSCSPTSVDVGGTSQCAATVSGTGSYSSAVTWSASGGTITAAGLLTAPASAGSVTVTATSTEDTSKSGTATVSVQNSAPVPTITSVSVSCSPTSVDVGGTSQCAATVSGTGSYSSAVTWSASGGTITAAGLLTAPASAGSVTVTATSTEDGTKSGTATVLVQVAAPKVPSSRHVVMVMEENTSYSAVVGNTGVWPGLNSLMMNGALPTNYFADTHPSIGNYFMLTTGQVLTNDDNSTQVWNVDNLARRMLAAGISFRVYAEGVTQGYLGGNTGLYLIRHNPFAMLSDVAGNQQVANQVIWPFSQFAVDLAAGNLPEFSFIVPNVDDDAHNGTPQQADSWLQTNVVTPLGNDSAFQPGGDGLLLVDFDEAADIDTSHGGGHVSPVLWGPAVKAGYRQASATVYQHESVLRTIMEALGLPSPPGAAAAAPDMSEFFVQGK